MINTTNNSFDNMKECIGISSALLNDNKNIQLQSVLNLFGGKNLGDLINKFNASVPDEAAMTELLGSLTGLVDTPDKVVTALKEEGVFDCLQQAASLMRKADDASTTVGNVVKTSAQFVAMLAILYASNNFIREPSRKNGFILLVISILTIVYDSTLDTLGLIKTMFAGAEDLFAKVFTSDDSIQMEPVIQSYNVDDFYDLAIGGWMTYVGIQSDKINKNDMKTFSELLRMRKSLPEFIVSIINFFKKIYNDTVAQYFNLGKLRINNFDDPYLEQFDSDVELLMTQKANGELSMSIENCARVQATLERAKQLYKSIPTTREYNSVRTLFVKTVDSLSKLKKDFDNANVHLNGFRPEAVGVLLRGGPGVHKSTIIMSIAASVAAATIDNTDFEEYLKYQQPFEYNRQHENVYMDGYGPKTITVFFDDLGQARDAAGNPDSEWMNIIRFINSFECMGHTAAIEQKGVMRIRPKFVLATTNMAKLASNSINCMGAVTRRFPVSVMAVPKPRYCKPGYVGYDDREFDYTLLPQVEVDGTIISDLKPNLFLYYRCDNDGRVIGNPFEYDDLIDIIITEHKKRESWAKQHLSNFNRVAIETRSRYFPSEKEIVNDKNSDISVQGWNPFSFKLVQQYDDLDIDCDDGTTITDLKLVTSRTNDKFHVINDLITKYDLDRLNLKSKWIDGSTMDEFYVRTRMSHIPQDTRTKFDNFKYNYGGFECGDMRSKILRHCESELAFDEYTDYDLELATWHYSEKVYVTLFLSTDDCYIDSILIPVSAVHFMCGAVRYSYHKFSQAMRVGFNKFKDWVVKLYDHIRSLTSRDWLIYSGIVAAATFAYDKLFPVKSKPNDIYITNLWSDSGSKGDYAPQMDYGATHKSQKRPQNRSLKQIKSMLNNSALAPTAQGVDVAGDELVKSIVDRNVCRFFSQATSDPDDLKLMGYCILLKKNKILVPLHFVEQLACGAAEVAERRDYKVILKATTENHYDDVYGTTTISDFIASARGEGLEDSHLCIVDMNTRDCRDISKKYFITDAILSRMFGTFEISVTFPHRKMSCHSRAYKMSIELPGVNHYYISNAIRYFADTYEGDCGAPIFVRNSRLHAHRIIGFHVAGTRQAHDECAFAAIVTQEMISDCLMQFEELDPMEDLDLTEPDIQSAPTFIKDRFTILGKVDNKHSPYGFTSIIPSLLQAPRGPIKSDMKVAMLRATQKVDPYKIALENYCSNDVVLDKELLEFCSDEFQSFLFSSPVSITPELLSVEEALWGDSDKEYLDAIKSSTSAGYPIKYDKDNIKKILFREGARRDSTNPGFKTVVEEIGKIIADAKDNKRQLWIYTDNLKDERRSIEKVAAGKSRLFNGCPFYYLLTFRIYFGSFIRWINLNSIKNGMVTAINPFSMQWDEIAMNLKSTSYESDPLVGDGDFKHYDGSMLTDVSWEVLRIINNWYDDGNDGIRSILWLEVTNSRHIYNDLIYEWFGSLPSGNPATLTINCMNNQIIHRYVFYRRHSRALKFHDIVKLFVTGDDLIMAVLDKYKATYNGVVVQELMKEIGYVYTSADKASKIVAFKRLSEVQFLKRSFRYEKLLSRYVGALDIKSVLEIPLWTKKSDSIAITEKNLVEFFDELSLHSPDVWKMYAVDYQKAVKVMLPDITLNGTLMMSRTQRLSRKLNQDIIF